MRIDVSKVSKTTVIGVLGFVIVEIIAWQTLPPKAGWSVTVLALARAGVHFLQTDADLLKPLSPGNPTPESVPAHPVPDIVTPK